MMRASVRLPYPLSQNLQKIMEQIRICQSTTSDTVIEVKVENDTIWLTQQQMAELFKQTKQNISLHINNCFSEGELEKDSTFKESLTVRMIRKRFEKK